ncbi:MAG: hypothetical protein NVSMB19_04140 [Vulcanimicrobiaceae bacterium]
MDRRIARGAALTTAALLLNAAPAPAANGTENYYTPPKLKTQGTSSTAVAGAGTVIVKVLVNKDGSAKVQGVVRSTNHGDDAPALEIAKTSTYQPATRGKLPQTAFYDFTLKFAAKGGSPSTTSDATQGGGDLAVFERQIRAGNYSGAQSGLTAYIALHPTDAKAQVDLGVASAYLNDATAAATAFGKGGTIPENYKALAAKAYNDAAAEAYKKKDYAASVVAAKRAVELAPGPFTYNTLGTAEDAANEHAAAIADLEKARTLATTDAALKPADRAHIAANLVSAYLNAGKPESAKPLLDEIAKLDPSQSDAQVSFANYYAKTASALVTAGKFVEGAAMYEQAAAAGPSQAVQSYIEAAFAYLKIKPNPANDKAKADADRALAIEPANASANFAAGIALANQAGKTKDALVYLNKAEASAKAGNDAGLTTAIEGIIKQLTGAK